MIKYLRDHIKEEINGAKDYYTKAVELKAQHPEWAMKFFKMGEMEIEHASCLTKMFNSIDKPNAMADAEYSESQKSIINDYATSMSVIENLKRLYWS